MNTPRYYLHPGEILVSREAAVIATVLGSSVSVYLRDRVTGASGVNHFMVPRPAGGQGPSGRFGTTAIPGMVRLLLAEGCAQENLSAQVFGGAARANRQGATLGPENAAVALKILESLMIPIISADLGGSLGRKVTIHTGVDEVAVYKVQKIREDDWLD